MNNKMFTGIMPALITPINNDRTFRRQAAEEVIKWETSFDIQGFYINGGTGEGPILPEKTRIEMAECAVDLCKGKVSIIDHIGAPDTESAFRLAKHAASIGCDAISSVLPNFYFDYTKDQILDYYKRITDAAGLPMIVYANKLMNVSAYDFMREIMNIEGVIGVKYTMPNYYDMHRICTINGGNINVINGPDETLLCGLVMGADGGIGTTYNISPDWFSDLYKAYKSGDLERARELQFRIDGMIDVIRRFPTSISVVKETFKYRGIDVGDAAYPGRVYTEEESKALRSELIAAGVKGI